MIDTSIKNIYSIVDIKMNVPFIYKQILSCKALKFIADVHLNFNDRRLQLQSLLSTKQNAVHQNTVQTYPSLIKNVRNGDSLHELKDYKVEVIEFSNLNLSNEELKTPNTLFVVDFSNHRSLSWGDLIDGQIKIKEIINSNISVNNDEDLDSDTMVEKLIMLMIKPRNLFSNESNFLVSKIPVSAAFFDFGLFFYHNAKKLIEQGCSPYFYLPYVKNEAEVKFWNDVFKFAEDRLGLPKGVTQAVI